MPSSAVPPPPSPSVSSALRIHKICALALGVTGSCLVGAGVSSGQERILATVRSGGEVDSNAFRTTDPETRRADVLARYFLALDTTWNRPRQSWFLSLSHGGKFFRTQPEVNTLLTQVNLGFTQGLTPSVQVGLQADLKDRSEADSIQDYNRGGGALILGLQLAERLRTRTRLGWRYFAFKPNPTASTHGPFGQVDLAWAPLQAWEVSGQYSLLQRRFDTPALALADDQIEDSAFVETAGFAREDVFHSVGAGLSWQGPMLLEVQYGLGVNRSNSYGQNLLRHVATLNLTVPLLPRLSAATRAQIQRTSYADPVLLDANFLVDEDNRNNLTLSLAYAFGLHWDLEARYSVYTQEFGSDSEYARHTFFLGLGYAFDSI